MKPPKTYQKKSNELREAKRIAVKLASEYGLMSTLPRTKKDKLNKVSPIEVIRPPKKKRHERQKLADARRPRKYAKKGILADKVTDRKPFDPARMVQEYIDGVLNGSIVVSRFVRMAVQRHLNDLKNAHERGFVFSPEKGAEAIWYFATCLRFTKGETAKKPFLQYEDIRDGNYLYGECSNFIPSPNQAFILWCVYGWVNKDSGYRRFKICYITAGRKWGKSEFGAGIALKQGSFDNPPEPGARVLIAATKKEQAFDLTWKQARQMVEISPVLSEMIEPFQYALVTEHRQPQPFSSIKAIGSNSKTSDGFDGSCVILDELHAWDNKKHGDFFDKLMTCTGSRRQPLTLIITTAGTEQSSIWLAKDQLYCNILEATVKLNQHIGDHIFAFIARLDEARECDCRGEDANCTFCKGTGTIPEDDLYDEANWPKANPNYPGTPTQAALREFVDTVKLDPIQRNAWKQYHCNMKSSSASKYITTALWGACGMSNLSDWKTAEVVTGGVDIGTRDDLASATLCAKFRMHKEQVAEVTERMLRFLNTEKLSKEVQRVINKNTVDQYRYELKNWTWIPLNPLRDLDREPWSSWIRSGQLIRCDGPTIDLEEVQNKVIALGKEHRVKAFRLDPHNATQMTQNLEKAGFEVVEHQQSYAMYNEPLREFLRLVKIRIINYNTSLSGLLSWAVNNTVIRKNTFRDEWMLDKEKSPEKIDPVTASVMAFAEAMYSAAAQKSRPYSGTGKGIFG